MATRKLEKAQWKDYFDAVSREIPGKQVELEVASLRLGDQIEAEWVPLTGLTYDPKDDLFEVVTEALDHLIQRPQEIYVQYDSDGLHSVEVIDADGNRHIVQLKSPLALPEPLTQAS